MIVLVRNDSALVALVTTHRQQITFHSIKNCTVHRSTRRCFVVSYSFVTLLPGELSLPSWSIQAGLSRTVHIHLSLYPKRIEIELVSEKVSFLKPVSYARIEFARTQNRPSSNFKMDSITVSRKPLPLSFLVTNTTSIILPQNQFVRNGGRKEYPTVRSHGPVFPRNSTVVIIVMVLVLVA